MAERLSGAWPEQLEELLERLRQEGFRIGVAETLRLHRLLLALVDRGVPLDDPQRLASLLGPVLCRSASEQEAFARHVRSWWPQPLPQPLPQPSPLQEALKAVEQPSALQEALQAVERRRNRLLRWLPTRPLALALAAGVAAAAVGVTGVVRWQQAARPDRAPGQPMPTPLPPGGAPVGKLPIAQPEPPRLEPQTPTEPATELLAREEGLLLLPLDFALLLPIGLLLSMAAVQGSVRWWWWRQARLVLQRLPSRGDPQLHRIALEAIDTNLLALPERHRLGRALNRWQSLPSGELDGAATVEQSLRQGGWLCPQYGLRRKQLSYLFLLDQESLADQQTRQLRAWLEGLRQEGVLVEWVCFQRQPSFCHGPGGLGPQRSLAELAALHPEAVAVVVADGERFFSQVDGSLQPWLKGLAAWPRRVALTPRPRAQWGATEAELDRQLPLLPASAEGLLALGPLLLEDSTRTTTPATLATAADPAQPPEPALLRGGAARWLERTPPAPAVVEQLLAELRSYLGADGFTWLAACAVFPDLHWTITAYLGQQLRNGAGQPLITGCPLLRLARLPWFRLGLLPDWLRLPLVLSLDADQQGAVRHALTQLLLGAVDGGQLEGGELGKAQLTVASHQGPSLPRLLPPLLERLRRRSGATSPLRDHLFLRFLQNRPLLAADAPDSLRRLMPQTLPAGWPWRPWRNLGSRGLVVAALLLLGLAGCSLLAVRQVKLAWIEQLLQTPSNQATASQLQRAITAFGISRSSLMPLGQGPELGRLEEALATGLSLPLKQLPQLQGHTALVTSVAFSPDGRRIVSGSLDNTLRLWDASNYKPLGTPLQGHTDWVSSVAFSPDGRRIVSGSYDGSLRLWDASSGKQLGPPLQGHINSVISVAFSPDGRRIVSGSDDKTLRLWDASSGKQLGTPLQGHTDWVFSVAFSPDGRLIVSGSRDNTLRLWDAISGMQLGPPLQGHIDSVTSVAFSPDGRRIVSSSADNTLRLWDAISGKQLGPPLQGHTAAVSSVAFSHDGRLIVSSSYDNTLRLWDASSGKPLSPPLQSHIDSVISVAFSPDGRRIVSGSADKTLRLWAWPAWQQSLPLACNKLKYHPLLENLAWLNSSRAVCDQLVWSQNRDKRRPLINISLQDHTSAVYSVAFSPDGRRIVSGSLDKTLRFWDFSSGQPNGWPLRGHSSWVSSVAFSPDGRRIVSGSGDNSLRLWDASSGEQLGPPLQGHTGGLVSVAFSPDGRRIVSGSADKTLRLWDAISGKPLGPPLQGHSSWVSSVAFSPNGRRIASCSFDKTLRLWNASSGKQLGPPLQGHTAEVISVAFSPDGRRIVSGSADKTLRLWDASSGKQLGPPLQGHIDSVYSVAFSPDGRRIVSGSLDKTLRLWDASSGKQLGPPLQGHTDAVWSVAFSPDGRHIVSGSYDGSLRLWDASGGSAR